MVGNPRDVRGLVLEHVMVPSRAAACWWTARAPPHPSASTRRHPGATLFAQDGTLFAHAATRPWSLSSSRSSPASAGRPAWGSWQSSKIAIQIAVAGAVVGLGEFVVFAHPAGLNAPLFLLGSSRCPSARRDRASRHLRQPLAPPRVHVRGGWQRAVHRQRPRHGARGWDGGEESNVLPGAALYWEMFSAMVDNGDGDLSL